MGWRDGDIWAAMAFSAAVATVVIVLFFLGCQRAQAIELINSFDMGKDFNYGERAMKEDRGRLKDVKTPDRYKGLLD